MIRCHQCITYVDLVKEQLDMRLVNCEYTLDKSKVILILQNLSLNPTKIS